MTLHIRSHRPAPLPETQEPSMQALPEEEVNALAPHQDRPESSALRWVGGSLAAALVIVGAKLVTPYITDGHDTSVMPPQTTLTPGQKYDNLQLAFATDPAVNNVGVASFVLRTILRNELYSEEHGGDDGYRAAFAQSAPDNFANFSDRVDGDRQISSILVAQHALHHNTYPTQEVTVEDITSVSKPSLDGRVTIGAKVVYVANIPGPDGTVHQQSDHLSGAYTIVKQVVTDFSDGQTRDIWVLRSQSTSSVTTDVPTATVSPSH